MKKLFIILIAFMLLAGCSSKKKTEDKATGNLVCTETTAGNNYKETYDIKDGTLNSVIVKQDMTYAFFDLVSDDVLVLKGDELEETKVLVIDKIDAGVEVNVEFTKEFVVVTYTVTKDNVDKVKHPKRDLKEMFKKDYTADKVNEDKANAEKDGATCTFTE